MKKPVQIRDARVDELDKVAALVRRSYQEFQPFVPPEAYDAWMDSIIDAILSWSGELIVAEQDGEIKGAIKFYPDGTHGGHWPEGSACMRILAVCPFCRGRGIGTRITRECIRRARKLNIPTIFLHTAKFMHAAQHVYEKVGFKRAPEFDLDYGPIAYRFDVPSKRRTDAPPKSG